MKTAALKQALQKYGFDAAFGGARRDGKKAAPRSASSPSAPPRIGGTRRTSARSCGSSTTGASTRARASASSRSPTGPSSTSGNTSPPRTFPWSHSISPRSDRSCSGTVKSFRDERGANQRTAKPDHRSRSGHIHGEEEAGRVFLMLQTLRDGADHMQAEPPPGGKKLLRFLTCGSVACCRGAYRSPWRRRSASRRWRMLWLVTESRTSSIPTEVRSSLARPSPACSPPTALRSAWTVKGLGGTTCLSSACSAASNTSRCIRGPTKAYPRLALRSAATWTFIMPGIPRTYASCLSAPNDSRLGGTVVRCSFGVWDGSAFGQRCRFIKRAGSCDGDRPAISSMS